MVTSYLPYYIASAILAIIVVAPITLLMFIIYWRRIIKRVEKEALKNDTGPIGENTIGELRTQEGTVDQDVDGRLEERRAIPLPPSDDTGIDGEQFKEDE